MALYYDLPVYRDTYQLVLKIFAVTKDFPKEYKFTLEQDMKRDALQLVRSIYRANKATQKKAHLENFLDEFELLKLEIRLCRILPIQKVLFGLLERLLLAVLSPWSSESGYPLCAQAVSIRVKC